MRKIGSVAFVVFVIAALYYLNKFFNLIALALPSNIENIIFLLTGILLIVGGVFALKANKF